VDYRRPAWVAPPAPPEREKPDWDGFVATWRERQKRAVLAERITSPSKLEEYDKINRLLYPIEEAPLAGSGRAVEIGVACHSVLEHLDFRAPAVPEGTDPEAAEILRAFFETDVFKELAGSEILARELPFIIPRPFDGAQGKGGQIVQGVIDVVYRRDGRVTVADYKTDKVIRPEEYGLIREIYTDAVRRVLKVEPRFQLIYLRQGREIVL
jgi:ATP-dependent exoDNAse (exonuclease V) beta subunit